MGSALNSVMGGGGGGGIGSIVGEIVGGIFGGPLGAEIGKALGKMIEGAAGDAVKDAASQLSKESGMPKFLADQIKQAVDEALAGNQQGGAQGAGHGHHGHGGAQDAAQGIAQDQFGGAIQDFKNDLTKQIVENTRKYMESAQESADCANGNKGTGKSGGKGGKASWLEAISRAMGEVLGDKSAKMVELSNKIKEVAGAGGDEKAQQASAKEMSALQSEMQGTSQMLSMLQAAFNNAIKSIGEGLTQMGRKG